MQLRPHILIQMCGIRMYIHVSTSVANIPSSSKTSHVIAIHIITTAIHQLPCTYLQMNQLNLLFIQQIMRYGVHNTHIHGHLTTHPPTCVHTCVRVVCTGCSVHDIYTVGSSTVKSRDFYLQRDVTRRKVGEDGRRNGHSADLLTLNMKREGVRSKGSH